MPQHCVPEELGDAPRARERSGGAGAVTASAVCLSVRGSASSAASQVCQPAPGCLSSTVLTGEREEAISPAVGRRQRRMGRQLRARAQR